jgi:hypothetical protein
VRCGFAGDAFWIVVAVHLLQVVPNELMETLAQTSRFFSGTGDQLLIDRLSGTTFTTTVQVRTYPV